MSQTDFSMLLVRYVALPLSWVKEKLEDSND